MATDVGKRLLGEVEEVGVGEILNALRLQDDTLTSSSPLGFPPLDRLLHAATEGRVQAIKAPPMVELMSLHSGGGATHLLYFLTALTVLPRDQGGKQSCAVILDTDGHFSANKLATQVRTLLIHKDKSDNEQSLDEAVVQTLRHVLVFRPQSLASVTATLENLPSYLFDQSRHFSFDRAVGFVAIDSVSAFYWQDRAEMEDAAFFAKTSAEPVATAPQSGYAALATVLKKACTALQCPAIFTEWHLGPLATTPLATRAFRPSLPPAFAALPMLRLACQRISVKKFPPFVSVEGALREANDRLKAVGERRFECFANEWDVDARTLRRLHGVGGGFEFMIGAEGVNIEAQV